MTGQCSKCGAKVSWLSTHENGLCATCAGTNTSTATERSATHVGVRIAILVVVGVAYVAVRMGGVPLSTMNWFILPWAIPVALYVLFIRPRRSS